MFFTFLKLYKWYQIVQSISYKSAIFFLFMNESNTTNYADETNFESEDNLTKSNLKSKLNLSFSWVDFKNWVDLFHVTFFIDILNFCFIKLFGLFMSLVYLAARQTLFLQNFLTVVYLIFKSTVIKSFLFSSCIFFKNGNSSDVFLSKNWVSWLLSFLTCSQSPFWKL